MIDLHAIVLLGFVLADWLGLHRTPFDKIGYFMQDFMPALVAR